VHADVKDVTMPQRPLIGITTDVITHHGRERCAMYPSYARAVAAAGGAPVLLSHEVDSIGTLVEALHGFVFTGGDDPRTEEFGEPTDPRATLLHPDRQRFEIALLRELSKRRPDTPVLGVCLGMQLMSLVAGGSLDQHLPESCATADDHWEREHAIVPGEAWEFGSGLVLSRHRQAVRDPGTLGVLARAHDGIIEAVGDPARRFYLGVQWHPERTARRSLGGELFDRLVRVAAQMNGRG